jgi:hypothetical protein
MPDFFNTSDHARVPDGAPRDWGDAFAALPLETPPGDGWSRVVHTLDARKPHGHRARRERRTNWLIGLASAAVLVVAAWSPLSRWLQDTPADAASPAVALTAAPGSRGLAAPVQTPSNPETVRAAAADAAEKATIAASADRHSRATITSQARSARAHRTARSAARLAAQPTQAQSPDSAPVTTDSVAATAPATDAVPSLQAQSARLEALVAIARDERVGNASSELLSAELDAGIAAVDAALSRDDLDDTRRQQLWQQRVDLLLQLAGVESTARWLAAQGMFNETALVSVD